MQCHDRILVERFECEKGLEILLLVQGRQKKKKKHRIKRFCHIDILDSPSGVRKSVGFTTMMCVFSPSFYLVCILERFSLFHFKTSSFKVRLYLSRNNFNCAVFRFSFVYLLYFVMMMSPSRNELISIFLFQSRFAYQIIW